MNVLFEESSKLPTDLSLKSRMGQNIVLHALPAVRDFAFRISAFPFHSTSFLFQNPRQTFNLDSILCNWLGSKHQLAYRQHKMTRVAAMNQCLICNIKNCFWHYTWLFFAAVWALSNIKSQSTSTFPLSLTPWWPPPPPSPSTPCQAHPQTGPWENETVSFPVCFGSSPPPPCLSPSR